MNARSEFIDEMASVVLDTLEIHPDGSLMTPVVTISDAIRHTTVGPPARLMKEKTETTAGTAPGHSSSSSSNSNNDTVVSVSGAADGSLLSRALTRVASNLPAPVVATENILNGAAHVSVLSLVAAAFSYVLEIKLEYILTCVVGAVLSVLLS